MTERAEFIARFEKKKQSGLVDVKFFVSDKVKPSLEEFFAESNRIDALTEAQGATVHHDLKELDARTRAAAAAEECHYS